MQGAYEDLPLLVGSGGIIDCKQQIASEIIWKGLECQKEAINVQCERGDAATSCSQVGR